MYHRPHVLQVLPGAVAVDGPGAGNYLDTDAHRIDDVVSNTDGLLQARALEENERMGEARHVDLDQLEADRRKRQAFQHFFMVGYFLVVVEIFAGVSSDLSLH